MGVVLIALAALPLQGQLLDVAVMIGMALIVAGVVVMNLEDGGALIILCPRSHPYG